MITLFEISSSPAFDLRIITRYCDREEKQQFFKWIFFGDNHEKDADNWINSFVDNIWMRRQGNERN